MSKASKIWLVAAALLVLIGAIIFGGAMTMLKWDFSKLGNVKYETNSYEIKEAFNNISIKAYSADIIIRPSANGETKVVCFEQSKVKHAVSVSDDTLNVEAADERKWYDHIEIFCKTPEITVYLPDTEYAKLLVRSNTGDVSLPKNFAFESIDVTLTTGDVECLASASGKIKISLSTGDVELSRVSAGAIELSTTTGEVELNSVKCDGSLYVKVTTGDAELENVTCKSFTSDGSTGDVTLENVIAEGSLRLKRSTGDVELYECDAADMKIETTTGSVKGSVLSEKNFVAKSSTGKVNVPPNTSGGVCEITTSTGDIKITLK